MEKTVRSLVRDNMLGDRQEGSAKGKKRRPVILLIDRASRRSGSRCWGQRCLANFDELRSAIQKEFGDLIEIRTMPAQGYAMMRTGAEMFEKATIVICMHGLAFFNTMCMKERGSYAIHLGWEGMWQLYAVLAKQHGVDFRNILTKGVGQHSSNVKAEIPVVVLEQENYWERRR